MNRDPEKGRRHDDLTDKSHHQDRRFRLCLFFADICSRHPGFRQNAVPDAAEDEPGDRLKLFVGHGGCFRHAAVHMGALTVEEARGLSLHYGGWVMLEKQGEGWTKVGGAWKKRTKADIQMRPEPA